MLVSDLLHRHGLTPVVNVSGTETVKGACPVAPEIMEAVNAVVGGSVDMLELQSAACRVIAGAFGAEAGMVVNNTAAGIAVAVAACMTGEDVVRIERLPDCTGLKNEVILQRGHHVNYGCAITQNIALAGARPVEIGAATECGAHALAGAIGERTAAALFVVSHHTVQSGLINLGTFCAVCRERGVPVIVDAAAESDPRIFLRAGADLVITSMHKQFQSLTAATIAGRLALVRACLMQQRGIGRAMKVGKEGIIAAIVAIERWRECDTVATTAAVDARLAAAERQLTGLPGITVACVVDETSRQFRRLHLQVDPARAGLSAFELATALAQRRPSIFVRSLQAEHGLLQLDFRQVTDAQAADVATAIARLVKDAAARPDGASPSRTPNAADSALESLSRFPLPLPDDARAGS